MVLLPSIQGLTERQRELFFLFQGVIVRHQPEGFGKLQDSDVAEAAAALAGTLETSAKGIIFEQRAATLVADRLAVELKELLTTARQRGATIYDREAAIALRAIEKGAVSCRDSGSDGRTYLALMARLLRATTPSAAVGNAAPGGTVIIP